MATATVNKVMTIFPRYKQKKRQVHYIHYLVFVLRCLVNSLKNLILIPHYIHFHLYAKHL